MRFSTRELVTLTVFGALWGAVEISLGSLLHGLNIPLSGVILAAVGLAIALTGRLFVPRPGATLFIGIIATILKLFSIGGVVIGPMIGILAEAAIAELILTVFGRPSRIAFIVAGGMGVLWTLAQPFFTGLLLFGRDFLSIWDDLVDRGGKALGLDASAVLWIVLALVVIHLAIGSLAGWLAWDAGRHLRSRLGGEPLLASE